MILVEHPPRTRQWRIHAQQKLLGEHLMNKIKLNEYSSSQSFVSPYAEDQIYEHPHRRKKTAVSLPLINISGRKTDQISWMILHWDKNGASIILFNDDMSLVHSINVFFDAWCVTFISALTWINTSKTNTSNMQILTDIISLLGWTESSIGFH